MRSSHPRTRGWGAASLRAARATITAESFQRWALRANMMLRLILVRGGSAERAPLRAPSTTSSTRASSDA
eukprot:4908813-Prymnesium_polylepis.1